MNNKLHSINKNNNYIHLLNISQYIESFNMDTQQTSISLKIINGMTFSFNWKSKNFNYLRNA